MTAPLSRRARHRRPRQSTQARHWLGARDGELLIAASLLSPAVLFALILASQE